jgi:hypothetical protein
MRTLCEAAFDSGEAVPESPSMLLTAWCDRMPGMIKKIQKRENATAGIASYGYIIETDTQGMVSSFETDSDRDGFGIKKGAEPVIPPATTISSYFGATPRMNGTIIADTTKQNAITR